MESGEYYVGLWLKSWPINGDLQIKMFILLFLKLRSWLLGHVELDFSSVSHQNFKSEGSAEPSRSCMPISLISASRSRNLHRSLLRLHSGSPTNLLFPQSPQLPRSRSPASANQMASPPPPGSPAAVDRGVPTSPGDSSLCRFGLVFLAPLVGF